MSLFKIVSIILPLTVFLSPSVEGSKKSTILVNSVLVDSTVLEQNSSIIVTMSNGTKSILSLINSRGIQSGSKKAFEIMTALEAHSKSTQAPVANVLNRLGVAFQTFWISNQIYIKDGNPSVVLALLDALPRDSGIVSEIREEIVARLFPTFGNAKVKRTPGNTWGVERIGAPAAWDNGTLGDGVIICVIDTGVKSSHEVLQDKLVGWKDASLSLLPLPGAPFPVDFQGHGTHVTGTIVGSNGIGVAPGAKYISCKACNILFCPQGALTACAEFVVCPNPTTCSNKAHVVSCSWGGDGGGDPWFDSVLDAWHTADIIPVFALGNAGPNCTTAGYPGESQKVIGVGAVDEDGEIADFSSRGPSTLHTDIKPDVVAPGVGIESASNLGNEEYEILSGTSMACPHVSGLVALLLSRNSGLKFNEIRKILTETTDTDLTSSGETCSGIADTAFPNYIFGFGHARCDNALGAVTLTEANMEEERN